MVPFVYLAFVCWSLQCLISALTQVGGGSLLFRFACSVLLWEGRSTHSVPATLGLPLLMGVCFPHLHCSGSRLLYREQALCCVRFQFSGSPQKRGLGWAQVLCLPRPSSSGSQELDECTLPRCSAPYPLRSPSLSFRALWSGGPCVCSQELVFSHDPPSGCQPSRISGSIWLETGSLFAVW